MRNEFALLEEKGYLTHPHTSAGRVPTDLGYREFVDYLMSGAAPRAGSAGAGAGMVRSAQSCPRTWPARSTPPFGRPPTPCRAPPTCWPWCSPRA